MSCAHETIKEPAEKYHIPRLDSNLSDNNNDTSNNSNSGEESSEGKCSKSSKAGLVDDVNVAGILKTVELPEKDSHDGANISFERERKDEDGQEIFLRSKNKDDLSSSDSDGSVVLADLGLKRKSKRRKKTGSSSEYNVEDNVLSQSTRKQKPGEEKPVSSEDEILPETDFFYNCDDDDSEGSLKLHKNKNMRKKKSRLSLFADDENSEEEDKAEDSKDEVKVSSVVNCSVLETSPSDENNGIEISLTGV